MKRTFLSLAVAALMATTACSSNDSTTAASDVTAPTDPTSAPANDGMGTTNTDSSGASTNTAMPADSGMAAGGSAMADPNGPTAPHATDAEFMKSAAASDQNEIQLSKLALEKGMVKDHANMMIKDHTKSTSDLKPLAQKKNVTLPADMDAEHKAIAATMGKLSGKEFETKYMDQMRIDHQKTLNTLVAHQKMTKDTELQGFITKVQPVVQSHLNMFTQHSKGAM
jgi:putative membrane protein